MHRAKAPVLLAAVMSVLVLGLAEGCTPEFWNGVAEGMASSGNAYAPPSGQAPERLNVCAKYMTQAGWSQGYSVSATFIKGTELNRRTGTFNYSPCSTYAVIFWDQGEASVLELAFYTGTLTAYGVDGTDQQGRQWHIAHTTYCF